MAEEISLAAVTDVMVLKALAYDRLAVIEQQQAELGAINARIQEILAGHADPSSAHAQGEPEHDGRVTRPRRAPAKRQGAKK